MKMKSSLWDKWQRTATVTCCEWSWWMIRCAPNTLLSQQTKKHFKSAKLQLGHLWVGLCYSVLTLLGVSGNMGNGHDHSLLFNRYGHGCNNQTLFEKMCKSCFMFLRLKKGGIAGIIGGGGKTWHWPMASPKLHPVPCPWALSNLFLSLLPIENSCKGTRHHFWHTDSLLKICHCQKHLWVGRRYFTIGKTSKQKKRF